MSIYNRTVIHLSFADRLRVLVGKPIRLNTEFKTTVETDVTETLQTVRVDRIFPEKPMCLKAGEGGSTSTSPARL